MISLIIPSYNNLQHLKNVYASIRKNAPQAKMMFLDDGSTDNTEEMVRKFQDESLFEIIYKKDKNRHKFLTVLDGIKMVETPYFMVLDSDDAYPENALEILVTEAEKIKNQEDYMFVLDAIQKKLN